MANITADPDSLCHSPYSNRLGQIKREDNMPSFPLFAAETTHTDHRPPHADGSLAPGDPYGCSTDPLRTRQLPRRRQLHAVAEVEFPVVGEAERAGEAADRLKLISLE